MNDFDYELLVSLYETGNITKLANLLYISQPTLTKRIHAIEEELGEEIIIRTSKGVMFTAAGEYAVKCSRKILDAKKQLVSDLGSLRGMIAGSIQIGASLNYSRFMLPLALKKYREAYPKVNIKVVSGHSKDLVHMFQTGSLDIVIVRGKYFTTESSVLLSSEPVCLIKNSPEPFSESTYIAHSTDPDEERRIERWINENGIKPKDRIQIDDISCCCQMTLAGIGWSIVPAICLRNFTGEILPLMLKDGTPLTRNTYILYRKELESLIQVQRLFDVLLQNEQSLSKDLCHESVFRRS